MAEAPVKAPVTFFTSAMRSTSLRLSTYFKYFSTSAFWASVVIFFTRSCSGASTMKSTPKMVSGRVVKTVRVGLSACVGLTPNPSPGERGTESRSDGELSNLFLISIRTPFKSAFTSSLVKRTTLNPSAFKNSVRASSNSLFSRW